MTWWGMYHRVVRKVDAVMRGPQEMETHGVKVVVNRYLE